MAMLLSLAVISVTTVSCNREDDDSSDTPSVGGFDANGASLAVFSVGENKTVRFSKGNLQYTTTGSHTVATGGSAPGTWRFAEHQYDYIGTDNENISNSYTGWIDLFGWATSGWNSGATYYQPWDTIRNKYGYGPRESGSFDLTGDYANADWGVYNAISNGGNQPGMWRTLTSEEWDYLLERRAASTVCGRDNARSRQCTVCFVNGIIILPDNFTMPKGVPDLFGTFNGYDLNYSEDQWSKLEAAGAIFLPDHGERYGTNYRSNQSGYWLASGYSSSYETNASYTDVISSTLPGYRNEGHYVRLVKDCQ